MSAAGSVLSMWTTEQAVRSAVCSRPRFQTRLTQVHHLQMLVEDGIGDVPLMSRPDLVRRQTCSFSSVQVGRQALLRRMSSSPQIQLERPARVPLVKTWMDWPNPRFESISSPIVRDDCRHDDDYHAQDGNAALFLNGLCDMQWAKTTLLILAQVEGRWCESQDV